MSTLTDRYVWAAVRTVPSSQRAELDPEVRELVGDAVEAKIATGLPAEQAEHQALAELGDPERLAAAYADRPLQLIGPRFYLDWWRSLRLLLTLVLPIVVAVVVVVTLLDDRNDVGDAVGNGIGALIDVGVHLCFWVTLAFAIVDRAGSDVRGAMTSGLRWTPERLPQLPTPGAGRLPDAVASVAFVAVWAGALVYQQVASPVRDANGDRVPVLNPDLWSFWLPFFLLVAAGEVVYAVVLYRRGRWSWSLAVANLVLNVAFAVPAIALLAGGSMLDGEFFDRIGWPEGARTGGWVTTVAILSIGLVSVWDAADAAYRAWRRDRPGGVRRQAVR